MRGIARRAADGHVSAKNAAISCRREMSGQDYIESPHQRISKNLTSSIDCCEYQNLKHRILPAIPCWHWVFGFCENISGNPRTSRGMVYPAIDDTIHAPKNLKLP
ncbi:hypothetical protein ACKZDW_00310 (plasmid) [Ralstonia syzygii subsp. celebesensis]